jgi:hypothetical protein
MRCKLTNAEQKRRTRSTPWGKAAHRQGVRKCNQRARLRCLIAYGGNPPKCACCGESIVGFLSLDHVNNNGAAHRKLLAGENQCPSAIFYRKLIKLGFPTDPPLIVLCFNCNMGRQRNGGICPHKGHKQSTNYRLTPRPQEVVSKVTYDPSSSQGLLFEELSS